MKTIKLPNQQLSNLYTLTGYATTNSLIVTNNTSGTVFLSESESEQENAYPLYFRQTALVHRGTDSWIKGRSEGSITVQRLSDTVLPIVTAEFPQDMVTSTEEGFRRLRVDVAQTGFFEGREFKFTDEINIPQGQSLAYEINVAIDTIIFDLDLEVDQGSARFRLIKDPTTFTSDTSAVQQVLRKNNISTAPLYTGVNTMNKHVNATISGGELENVTRIISSNATSKLTTVGGRYKEQGFEICTLYVFIENIGNNAILGTFNGFWEERPTT